MTSNLNLYAYVGNDPVNARDPSGRQSETAWDLKLGIGPPGGVQLPGTTLAEAGATSSRVHSDSWRFSSLQRSVSESNFRKTGSPQQSV